MKSLGKPFHLAGVRFSDEGEIKLPLDIANAQVRIIHQPDNKFDPFALAVFINSVRCGWVPRSEQAAWFYYTLQNVRIVPALKTFDRERPPHEQISIQYMCADSYVTEVLNLTNHATVP